MTNEFWSIVKTVESHLSDEEYDRMGFDATSSGGYGLADEFADVVGHIKVNSLSARDKVMRIIHNNVQLVPTGLEIRWHNQDNDQWFIIFVPTSLR